MTYSKEDFDIAMSRKDSLLREQEQKIIELQNERARNASAVGHVNRSVEEALTFCQRFPAILQEIETSSEKRAKRLEEIERLATYLTHGKANMALVLAGKEPDGSIGSDAGAGGEQGRSKKKS